MSYTSNIHIEKTRRRAVQDVRTGRKTQAEAARYYGVNKSTIHKWLKRASYNHREHVITISSKPKNHPNTLSLKLIEEVIKLREETGRCTPILHAMLKDKGIFISQSSVARILRKHGLTRKKKQLKPKYAKVKRPLPKEPGILVEMDTIHYVRSDGTRFYIYTMIDVCTRYAYAEYSGYLSSTKSYGVVKKALKYFPFQIKLIQTDNGGEFSEHFYYLLQEKKITLRHTRIRKPNDNAHIERFNRTLQEEAFKSRIPNERTIQRDLKKYLNYYNNERYHFGINCNTPCYLVAKLLN